MANLGGEYAEAAALRAQAEDLATDAGTVQESVPAGGTLVVTLANPLSQFHLGGSPSTEEIEVLSNVYERLLESDETGHLVPTLCREWEGTERGRVFRFTLRDEVRFFRWLVPARRGREAIVRKTPPAASGKLPAPAFRAIEGIEDFLAGREEDLKGVQAPAERVVEFRLSQPLPIFPALLTDPRTAIAGESRNGCPPVGTGRSAGRPAPLWTRRRATYWNVGKTIGAGGRRGSTVSSSGSSTATAIPWLASSRGRSTSYAICWSKTWKTYSGSHASPAACMRRPRKTCSTCS